MRGVALFQTVKREGSRAFFRNTPITGLTPFADLGGQAQAYFRLQQPQSYVINAQFPDGTHRATLNVHTGRLGGFAEAKPFTEVHVTYVTDDLSATLANSGSMIAHVRGYQRERRVCH